MSKYDKLSLKRDKDVVAVFGEHDLVLLVAQAAHEANRSLCVAIGDDSQVPWEKAPVEIKRSAVNGVLEFYEKPEMTTQMQHVMWCYDKKTAGWTYGPVKDAEEKTHPFLVPYDELPVAQRMKDVLFQTVVRCALDAALMIANEGK